MLSIRWTPHQIHQGRWADRQPFGQLSRANPSKRKKTLEKLVLRGPMLEDGLNWQLTRSEQGPGHSRSKTFHEKTDPVVARS